MGSGGGGLAAMTVVWVVLAVLAMGGIMAFFMLRQRGQRARAGKTGNGR